MPNPYRVASDNSLLAALHADDRRHFADQTDHVALAVDDVLAEQDAAVGHVYFPLEGMISVITGDHGHANLQVGLIGWEGMLGATLTLGVNRSTASARVQAPGSALRMETSAFLALLAANGGLNRVVQRYLYVTIVQLAQTTLCTHFHVLEARLARWLLMTHDRVGSDTFAVTHAFLAYVLGVRRVGVTKAASALQQRKVIRYQRGSLTVMDRAGLEATSCDCYHSDRAAYARLMR